MYELIEAAAKRLDGIAHRTPVLTSKQLNNMVGAEIYVKCENFQRVGAFKFRGAYNALSRLTAEERARGVVTYSSGNHAQALSLSAKLLGCKAVILMPQDAPAVKIDAVKGYGAEIMFYNRFTDVREELASELVKEYGYTFVHPYNNINVIAGQGTVAKELFEKVGDLDYLFVQCGGGGLISGCSIAAKHLSSNCKTIGVEPEISNVIARSVKEGKILHIDAPKSIADGLNSATTGTVTFPIIQKYVDSLVTVSEKQIIEALYFLWTRMKIVAEPSGAVPIAAIMNSNIHLKGKKIGVVISGGNVDIAAIAPLFAEMHK